MPSAETKKTIFEHISDFLVNGQWGAWSSLTQCTVTCGGGFQSQTRVCDSPAPSNGGNDCGTENSQTVRCQIEDCPLGISTHL